MQKEQVAEIQVVGRRELTELQAAAKQRVDALQKAAKKADDEFRPEEAAITRKRLVLWQGADGDPGILERIADQMSLYEPAFSDNGREPAGQQEIFDGVDRPQPEPVMDLAALKAALILSGVTGAVGAEAFEGLDDVQEDDERKTAYLGRASIELLGTLPGIMALSLFESAVLVLDGDVGEEGLGADEIERFDVLATAIAKDGSALAPFYEAFPTSTKHDPIYDPIIAQGDAQKLDEDDWADLTESQLAEIVERFEARREAEAIAAEEEPEGVAGVGPEDEPEQPWDEGPEAWKGEAQPAAKAVTVPPEADDVDDLLNG